MTKIFDKKYMFNFFSFFSVSIILIAIIIITFVITCLCAVCCSKEEKKNDRVYSSETKKTVEEEDLHEVVTTAQGGTFDIYVPKTPKLSQVFPFPYKWDGRAWVPASTAEYLINN